MTLKANSLLASASIGWEQQKTNGSFANSKQGPDTLTASYQPLTTTYTDIYLAEGTLAASASVTLDLYSFTDKLGTAVTATKLLGILIKATATVTGGQLKIEQGASNPLTWFFSGTTPAITLDVGTLGACFMVKEGTSETLSSTVRNLKLSNPGTQTITYYVAAMVGA